MKNKKEEFAVFQRKIAYRFIGSAMLSISIVILLYLFLWQRRLGDLMVSFLENCLGMTPEESFLVYHLHFREYKEVFLAAAMIVIFFLLLLLLFRWMTHYFKEINQGIDALLTEDDTAIQLSSEMHPFAHKLNTVKQTLKKQKEEAALAEQRKNELVMYLAHDIRTPLTSVIGYLNLLEEQPQMPQAERIKDVHIALDKAGRLEKMIHELFEMTRYHSRQITLSKKQVDLYYMLIQLCDELSPVFSQHNHSVVLQCSESLSIFADPDKMVRVFSNILKNAAAYSYPATEIIISAEETDQATTILFENKGKTIPADELPLLFDKFYRVDKARISHTGGTGLGLAIAKEIVLLHGGTITAYSEKETIRIAVHLPRL